MARFPFIDMPQRVRKEPLGPVSLNQLKANVEALQSLMLYEHTDAGKHNALEVPRLAGCNTWSSPNYTHYYNGDYYTSANNIAPGQVDLTLASGGFTLPYVTAIAACCDDDVVNKPWMVNVYIVSATSVSVYVSKLSSALGAGNTWAAADGAFSLALHSPAVAATPSLIAMSNKQRRDWLTEESTDWNSLVGAQGQLRAKALAKHTSAGEHSDPLISKEYVHASFDGKPWGPTPGATTYTIEAGNVSAVTYVSGGVAEITTTTTYSATTAMFAFPEIIPADETELYVINYRPTATNKVRVYMYQYDFTADTWARVNMDFFVSIHGS